jgi:hypothetical protein
MATTHPRLEDCLLSPDGPDANLLRDMLVDPQADRHQAGKLKLEGTYTAGKPPTHARDVVVVSLTSTLTAGLFRNAKCYYLANPVLGEEHRRMKGVSRQTQKVLPLALFGQDPRTNSAVVHSVALRSTVGFEMTLQEESRTITHGLNFKRRAVVR